MKKVKPITKKSRNNYWIQYSEEKDAVIIDINMKDLENIKIFQREVYLVIYLSRIVNKSLSSALYIA